MGLGQAVIVAGIGCRRDAAAADIIGALDRALSEAGRTRRDLACIAVPAAKAGEAGIAAAAAACGLELVVVPQAEFEAAGDRALSHSDKALALMGVPSVAEAAALAAAGERSRLVVLRVIHGAATCALAAAEDAP